jgi:hypothetical protein
MSKKAFDKIAEGLHDAVARGEAAPASCRVKIDGRRGNYGVVFTDLPGCTAAIRRSKLPRVRRNGAVGAREIRSGLTKAQLRAQTAEAVTGYSGPITRCAPKRRRSP